MIVSHVTNWFCFIYLKKKKKKKKDFKGLVPPKQCSYFRKDLSTYLDITTIVYIISQEVVKVKYMWLVST